MVRALVAEMLRELGYDVCEAGSAKIAWAVLAKGTPISTVITDIRMPDITGIELATQIRKSRPDLRVIYMTGYAKEAALSDSHLLKHDVLIKPFTFEQLEAVMTQRAPRH